MTPEPLDPKALERAIDEAQNDKGPGQDVHVPRRELSHERDELADFVGKAVVLDTRGELIYLGTLSAVGDWFLTLVEADVHDVESTRTSKEVYIMESARHGIRTNRERVMVRKSEVVSLSLIDDVVQY